VSDYPHMKKIRTMSTYECGKIRDLHTVKCNKNNLVVGNIWFVVLS